MAKNKETGVDETPENQPTGLPPSGSPPAPDNAPKPETIPGGRYKTADGRLVNAEGKSITEDGKPVADPNPAETPRETA